MDARVFLTLIVFGLTETPLKAESKSPPVHETEQRAREVLHEWSEECLSFTGVQGEILRIDYDDVFQQQKHSVGTFGYLGPQYGFFRYNPAPNQPDPDSLKKAPDGSPYEYKEGFSEEWRWQKSWIRSIDHREKKYEEFRIIKRPQTESEPKWYDFGRYFSEMDNMAPVLPGVPNQAKFDEFISHSYLMVIRENDTHITIAGKPKLRRHAVFFQEFKLHLEKRPWRLKAVQYIQQGGQTSTVYLFTNVEFNPLERDDEPDLSDYQNLNDQPIAARYHENAERQSFQKKVGSQPSGSGSLMDLIFHLLF